MNHQAGIERLLYITLLVVFIASAVGGVVAKISFDKLNQEQKALQALAKQNEALGQENQSIAKQNRAYSRCIATIFAQYTHDFIPVTILDLDTCTIDSQTKATDSTPASGTVPSPQSSTATKSVPPQTPASSTSPPQSSGPTPVQVVQNAISGIIKALGL